MPASYVHICAASRAVLKWAPEKEEIILDAVLAGAEGPDPLFYSFIPKKGRTGAPKLGTLIHKKRTGAFLDELAKNCRDSALLRSFLYGFLSHYATDTVCHPYIFTKSFDDNGKLDSNKHCKYEHAMDVYIYRRLGNVKGLPLQFGGYAKLKAAEKNKIAEAFHKAVAAVFPEEGLEYRDVRKSFDDAVFYCKLLRSCAAKKKSLLLSVALKTKAAGLVDSHTMPNVPVTAFEGSYSVSGFTWDTMLNNEHSEWRSPWEPEKARNESFDELYTAAVARSVEFMEAARGYFTGDITADRFSAIHGDMSYDSGIPWEKTKAL